MIRCNFCQENIYFDEYEQHNQECEDNFRCSTYFSRNNQVPTGQNIRSFIRNTFNTRRIWYDDQNLPNTTFIEITPPSTPVLGSSPVNDISINQAMVVVTDLINIDNTSECSICIELLSSKNKKNIVSLVQCGHKFCRQCITKWLRSNNNCPLCKAVLF